MSQTITTKPVKEVKYLLGALGSASGYYTQLKATFASEDVYKFFAQPAVIESSNQITWVTDFNGTATEYAKLSLQDQEFVEQLLIKKMKKIREITAKFNDNSFTEHINKCLEIPSVEDVWKVGNEVVVTQWGFIFDGTKGKTGILQLIIAGERIPVTILVQYSDQTPVQNISVECKYSSQTENYSTDSEGKFTIKKVRPNAEIIASVIKNGNPLKTEKFIAYADGKYVITLEKPQEKPVEEEKPIIPDVKPQTFSAKVKVVYKKNKNEEVVVQNAKIIVEYNGKKIEGLTTDNQGYVELKNLEIKNGDILNVDVVVDDKDLPK